MIFGLVFSLFLGDAFQLYHNRHALTSFVLIVCFVSALPLLLSYCLNMFLCFRHCILSYVGVLCAQYIINQLYRIFPRRRQRRLVLSFPMSLPKCLTGSAYDRSLLPVHNVHDSS